MEGPWAVCGDFNVSRFISEKNNCRRRSKGMKEFSDFIEDMNLIDLQLENASYTRFKGDCHDAASRIDRILLSEEWDNCFNNLKQVPLQRLISDHIPIALQGGAWNCNKRYFKFENWWLSSDGFLDRVKGWWSNFNFSGKPDYILACKLKALKCKLKDWSKEVQGNLSSQKKLLLGKLADLDAVLEARILTEVENERKSALFLEYEELLKKEEIAWRQRSRTLWLKEGNMNTKFFHKMANAHRRYNNIDQLCIQGETTEDASRTEGEIVEFYKNLYTEAVLWRPDYEFPNCPVLTGDERENLQRNFEEEEVFRCLKSGTADKPLDQMVLPWISTSNVGRW